MKTIPHELSEAPRVDGAGVLRPVLAGGALPRCGVRRWPRWRHWSSPGSTTTSVGDRAESRPGTRCHHLGAETTSAARFFTDNNLVAGRIPAGGTADPRRVLHPATAVRGGSPSAQPRAEGSTHRSGRVDTRSSCLRPAKAAVVDPFRYRVSTLQLRCGGGGQFDGHQCARPRVHGRVDGAPCRSAALSHDGKPEAGARRVRASEDR